MNLRGRIILALATTCIMVPAHGRPAPPQEIQPSTVVSTIPEVTQVSPVAPCLQPPPVVRWQDYEGPLKGVVGVVGRRLERNTVTPGTHYKPGTVFCSLTLKGKFIRFAENSTDPIAFLTASSGGHDPPIRPRCGRIRKAVWGQPCRPSFGRILHRGGVLGDLSRRPTLLSPRVRRRKAALLPCCGACRCSSARGRPKRIQFLRMARNGERRHLELHVSSKNGHGCRDYHRACRYGSCAGCRLGCSSGVLA